jgi:hypothetical protein
LSVEPDVLIGGEKPSQFRPDNLDDIAQHGDEDETSVECEDETSPARRPHGELEPVEGGKFRVDCLRWDQGKKTGANEKSLPDCAIRSQRRRNGGRRK